MDLWDLAEQLAYDNFQSYSCENDIAEEEGYDPDEMEESDWDESPIKYCTEVPGKKNTSFVIMDFMGKSLLCAWRNNKTCKVGMPFLCKRVIKRVKSDSK